MDSRREWKCRCARINRLTEAKCWHCGRSKPPQPEPIKTYHSEVLGRVTIPEDSEVAS